MTAAADPKYFFIIGAMKAGTTSLYKYLSAHPQLYGSPRKEPRVFRDHKDSEQLRSEFLGLFEERQDEPWCFEASTAYTKFPRIAGVPQRIQTIVPGARFVYLVRDPVDRVWSQYLHNLAHGRETRPFAHAIEEDPQYLDISRYHLQLSQYYKVFPTGRILVQVFEEMVNDPAATVRAICEFLAVDSSFAPPTADVAYNVSSEKRTAPRALRVAKSLGVEALVPWQARHWLKRQGAQLPAKKTELTPELRALAVDSLRDDAEAFFKLIGRRIPSWSDYA